MVHHLVHGTHSVRIKSAVYPIAPLERSQIEIYTQPKVQRQLSGHFPVILNVWGIVPLDRRRQYSYIGAAAAGETQQEGRQRVPVLYSRIIAIKLAPRKVPSSLQPEYVVLAGIYLVEDDQAEIKTRLDEVALINFRDRRMNREAIRVQVSADPAE
jgi:hypothetical protein